MTERTFRKKPIEIQAVKVADALAAARASWQSLPAWLRDAYDAGTVVFIGDGILIRTLEGEMRAARGDCLIQGVQGELYPCRADIFAATYESATSPEEV